MSQNTKEKKAAREYQREHGCSYSHALAVVRAEAVEKKAPFAEKDAVLDELRGTAEAEFVDSVSGGAGER